MINSRFSIAALILLFCFLKANAQTTLEAKDIPGNLFKLSVFETPESPGQAAKPLTGTTIEVFNRTQNKSEWAFKNNPKATFQYIFGPGNQYTMLIRKPGYLAKRVEVYNHIKTCILCVDGLRSFGPAPRTDFGRWGTLLGEIELEPVKPGKRIPLQVIYYETDQWDIHLETAKQFKQIVTLLKDNPGLTFELGSHTDSRGKDDYNLTLSQKRADAAVDYIVRQGVDPHRITAKGYGETQLTNRCRNGVDCTELEHQQNRRTELRITGISNDSLEYKRWLSLEQLIQQEQGAIATGDVPKRADDEDKTGAGRPETLMEKGDVEFSVPPTPPVGTGMPAGSTPVEDIVLRITVLPEKYRGYAIEIAQGPTELPADLPAFREQNEVLLQQDKAGNYCYFIGNIGGREKAYEFFRRKIRAANRDARMVIFGQNGKKTYLKP